MASRDDEIREVVTALDGLLDDLRVNVSALTEILDSRDGEQEGAPA